jgi:hypothetical protein
LTAVVHRAVATIAAVAFAVFAWKHARYILTTTVQFDDAFIANVAKNLAEGHGYAASYYGLRPFDLEITTGPTVVFPAAAMMRVFGNQYWVPTASYTILIGALITQLLAMLRRRLPRGAFATVSALIGLCLVAFGAQEIGLLGELPAALLTAIAALVLTRQPDAHWRTSASGLILGLAVLAKAVAALAVPAFAVALLTLPMFRARRMRTAVDFAIGVCLPIVVFEMWKLAIIGSIGGWVELVTNELLDVAGPNAPLSGSATVFSALSDPLAVVRNARHNLVPLLAWWGGTRNPALAPIWFGGWLPAVLFTIGVLGTLRAALDYARDPDSSPVTTSGLILIVAGVSSFFWWLFLAPMGWPRHAQPGLFRTLIGCSMVIGAGVPRNARLPAVSALAFVLALAPNVFDLRHPYSPIDDFVRDMSGGPPQTPRLRAARTTADFLHGIETADPGAQLVGCGWSHNPSLEYLMPGSDHFRDCLLIRATKLRGHRLILVRGEYFNQLNLPDIRQFQDWCEQHVVFRAVPWVVSECPGPPPAPPWQ